MQVNNRKVAKLLGNGVQAPKAKRGVMQYTGNKNINDVLAVSANGSDLNSESYTAVHERRFR